MQDESSWSNSNVISAGLIDDKNNQTDEDHSLLSSSFPYFKNDCEMTDNNCNEGNICNMDNAQDEKFNMKSIINSNEINNIFRSYGCVKLTTDEKNSQPKKTRKKKKGSQRNKDKKDEMIKKFKVYFINVILDTINTKFEDEPIYIQIKSRNEIIEVNRLLDIDNKIKIKHNANDIDEFLESNCKTIFSIDISSKNNNYPKDYNRLVIKQLYDEKKEKVTKILDMKVKKCLKYFRKDPDVFGKPEYECLDGIEKKFDDLKENLKNDNDNYYMNNYIDLINEFENIGKQNPKSGKERRIRGIKRRREVRREVRRKKRGRKIILLNRIRIKDNQKILHIIKYKDGNNIINYNIILPNDLI